MGESLDQTHSQCVIVGDFILATLDRVRDELVATGELTPQLHGVSIETKRRQVIEYLITLYLKHRLSDRKPELLKADTDIKDEKPPLSNNQPENHEGWFHRSDSVPLDSGGLQPNYNFVPTRAGRHHSEDHPDDEVVFVGSSRWRDENRHVHEDIGTLNGENRTNDEVMFLGSRRRGSDYACGSRGNSVSHEVMSSRPSKWHSGDQVGNESHEVVSSRPSRWRSGDQVETESHEVVSSRPSRWRSGDQVETESHEVVSSRTSRWHNEDQLETEETNGLNSDNRLESEFTSEEPTMYNVDNNNEQVTYTHVPTRKRKSHKHKSKEPEVGEEESDFYRICGQDSDIIGAQTCSYNKKGRSSLKTVATHNTAAQPSTDVSTTQSVENESSVNQRISDSKDSCFKVGETQSPSKPLPSLKRKILLKEKKKRRGRPKKIVEPGNANDAEVTIGDNDESILSDNREVGGVGDNRESGAVSDNRGVSITSDNLDIGAMSNSRLTCKINKKSKRGPVKNPRSRLVKRLIGNTSPQPVVSLVKLSPRQLAEASQIYYKAETSVLKKKDLDEDMKAACEKNGDSYTESYLGITHPSSKGEVTQKRIVGRKRRKGKLVTVRTTLVTSDNKEEQSEEVSMTTDKVKDSGLVEEMGGIQGNIINDGVSGEIIGSHAGKNSSNQGDNNAQGDKMSSNHADNGCQGDNMVADDNFETLDTYDLYDDDVKDKDYVPEEQEKQDEDMVDSGAVLEQVTQVVQRIYNDEKPVQRKKKKKGRHMVMNVVWDDLENYTKVTEVTPDMKITDLFFRVRNQEKFELVCRVCDYHAHDTARMRVHMRQHTAQRSKEAVCATPVALPDGSTFQCPVSKCGYQSTKSHVLYHIKQVHNKNHMCAKCGKKFPFLFLLNKHMEVKHAKGPGFICCSCGKGFQTKQGLDQHQRVNHSSGVEVNRYTCELCQKTLPNAHRLKDHISSVHTKSRPHTCQLCNKSFIWASSLERHRNTAHNKKTVSCDLCFREFTTTEGLRRHRLHIHGGQIHECPMCRKVYKWDSSLQRHVKNCTAV